MSSGCLCKVQASSVTHLISLYNVSISISRCMKESNIWEKFLTCHWLNPKSLIFLVNWQAKRAELKDTDIICLLLCRYHANRMLSFYPPGEFSLGYGLFLVNSFFRKKMSPAGCWLNSIFLVLPQGQCSSSLHFGCMFLLVCSKISFSTIETQTTNLYHVAPLYSLNVEECSTSITPRTVQKMADALHEGSVLSHLSLGISFARHL